MILSLVDVIRDALTPTLYGGIAKAGGYLNAVGVVGVAASASSSVVLGIPVSDWKVYGIIVGAFCGIAGLVVQVVFKWLEHRHRVRVSAYTRRKTDR